MNHGVTSPHALSHRIMEEVGSSTGLLSTTDATQSSSRVHNHFKMKSLKALDSAAIISRLQSPRDETYSSTTNRNKVDSGIGLAKRIDSEAAMTDMEKESAMFIQKG